MSQIADLAAWMMVKNEAASIRKTIESLRGSVDCLVLVDTGSTDDTVGHAVMAAEEFDLKLHVQHETFIDFATTRNRCLELAERHGKWLLMLNGDETLCGGEGIRRYLEGKALDAVNVEVDFGSLTFRHPRLTRAGGPGRYEGRTHEALVGATVGDAVPGTRIVRGPENAQKKLAQWHRDEVLLSEDLREDPDNPRAQFYLGQTLELLGREDAAARLYRARADNRRGWDAERYEALLRLAQIERRDAVDHLTHAVELYPSWPEAYTLLAEHYFNQKRWQSCYLYSKRACQLAFSSNALFTAKRLDLLRWDLLSASAFYAGDAKRGRFATLMALGKPGCDEQRLRRAFSFHRPSFDDRPGSECIEGTLVLVVGTGRSGTSVVTRILEALGVDMGPSIEADEHAPEGYAEDRHVRQFTGFDQDYPGLWSYLAARLEASADMLVGCKSPYLADAPDEVRQAAPDLERIVVINCERDLALVQQSFVRAWGRFANEEGLLALQKRQQGARELAEAYDGLTVPLDELCDSPNYWVQIIADHVFGGVSLDDQQMHDRIAQATSLVRAERL